MNRIAMVAALALIALMLLASTLFIVDQRQFAVVYALGEIKSVITEPGLKVKLPPPFQNVVFLDRRVQTLDSPETRPIFTAEKKSLVIDWLIKWRIVDVRRRAVPAATRWMHRPKPRRVTRQSFARSRPPCA